MQECHEEIEAADIADRPVPDVLLHGEPDAPGSGDDSGRLREVELDMVPPRRHQEGNRESGRQQVTKKTHAALCHKSTMAAVSVLSFRVRGCVLAPRGQSLQKSSITDG